MASQQTFQDNPKNVLIYWPFSNTMITKIGKYSSSNICLLVRILHSEFSLENAILTWVDALKYSQDIGGSVESSRAMRCDLKLLSNTVSFRFNIFFLQAWYVTTRFQFAIEDYYVWHYSFLVHAWNKTREGSRFFWSRMSHASPQFLPLSAFTMSVINKTAVSMSIAATPVFSNHCRNAALDFFSNKNTKASSGPPRTDVCCASAMTLSLTRVGKAANASCTDNWNGFSSLESLVSDIASVMEPVNIFCAVACDFFSQCFDTCLKCSVVWFDGFFFTLGIFLEATSNAFTNSMRDLNLNATLDEKQSYFISQ